MDEFGGTQFEGIANTVRRKRSQTSRRPKPESQPLPESCDQSSLSSTPASDDVPKFSSDENTGYDGSSKRKLFNLNQCTSNGSSATRVEGEQAQKTMEDGGSGVLGDGVVNESKFKKVKLKVGGVTRTIHTKPTSNATFGSGSSTKIVQPSDAPRSRPKLILQDDSDEDNSPPPDKKHGLQGIPWKDFSGGGYSIGKEESLIGKMSEKSVSRKQGEKSDSVHKSKRVPKKRELNGEFDVDDEDDDEIRYLEKLRTSRVATGYKDVEEESSIKHRSISRVSKGGKYENLKESVPSRSGRDGKKSRSEDTDYEEEEQMSDVEPDAKKKKKKPRKDSPDLPTESKRDLALTTRQRALLSGKDASSVAAANPIEFPNGLPTPPSRKQKLTDVEQQLKKAEAAERRRMQSEKAARESQAEAIRKILGQDSSRKKREDKLKKRQKELAQEKAANAKTLPPNTVRCVMGPTGTTVIFSEDMGLPHIFDSKPSSYPPPREKCAGPSCNNLYKYRDSKSRVPLCSLQCYKAIHEKMQPETAC